MPRPVAERPLKQHTLKTVMLRVPTPVWPAVSTGRVREFRAATGNVPQLWHIPLPVLAVAYRRQLSARHYDYRLIMLEGIRREMLGAITEEGLAAAGYDGEDARARFRRDWMIAEKKKFEPLRTVVVFTVRLVQSKDDLDVAGRSIVDHLYGEYLDEQAHERTKTIDAAQPPRGRSRRQAASSGRGR